MIYSSYCETVNKTYITNGTLYSYTKHLNQRMNERAISEIDLKMALSFGKRFKDPSGETKEFSILHIDECDYEGQKTIHGTKATYIVVCHVKNKYGHGRAVTTSFYDDENGGKIQFNILSKRI